MPHAIFVRRPGNYFDPSAKPLAIDIANEEGAQRIARRLARSYPCHGQHDERGVLWFRDREGLVEIWPQRQG